VVIIIYEEIFLGIFGVFLTAQTGMVYAQGKQISKLSAMIGTICREHRMNHGGDPID
jgi:hypothetical protein